MKSMAALVFPEFQTLDFFGPIEMLGGFRDQIRVTTVAKTADPVVSRHRQRIVVDKTLHDGTQYDILFIPGSDAQNGGRDGIPLER